MYLFSIFLETKNPNDVLNLPKLDLVFPIRLSWSRRGPNTRRPTWSCRCSFSRRWSRYPQSAQLCVTYSSATRTRWVNVMAESAKKPEQNGNDFYLHRAFALLWSVKTEPESRGGERCSLRAAGPQGAAGEEWGGEEDFGKSAIWGQQLSHTAPGRRYLLESEDTSLSNAGSKNNPVHTVWVV